MIEVKTLAQAKHIIDLQDAQLHLLNAELTETTEPNILLFECVEIALKMLEEYTEYKRKNGVTAKGVASEKRLIKLYSNLSKLNSLGDSLHSMKIGIKFVNAQNKKLVNELNEINRQERESNRLTNKLADEIQKVEQEKQNQGRKTA